MSNTDNTNTSHCDQCAVPLTESNHGFFAWLDRCDRCSDRYDVTDELLEIAYMANKLGINTKSVDSLRHSAANLHVRVQELKRPIEDGGDSRLAHIWKALWDALDGDIERNETWGLFIDAVAGDVPDFRTKRYGGVVTLKFYFSDVEVKGDVDGHELEQAILDEIEGDLAYGYENECEVDYEEE
jgi:hypothetical protein